MNTTNLSANYHQLLQHLKASGYSKGYIARFQSVIDSIVRLAEDGKIISYADAYQEFENQGWSKSYLGQIRTIIGEIQLFDLNGELPDGTRKQRLVAKTTYFQLNEEYRSMIDYFVDIETNRGLQSSTIKVTSNNAAVFLLFLQNRGIDSLDDITEETVMRAFITSEGTIIRGYNPKQSVDSFMRTCMSQFPNCAKVPPLLPVFKKRRKNIQYLKPNEIVKFKHALFADNSRLSLRDKAVGVLTLYTGLRSCDMAGLKLESVDFPNDCLRICQQKTNKLLVLPLSAIVGNALYDYIKSERGKSESEFVFLSLSRPFNRLKASSIGDIIARVMKAANIRQEPGDRKGAHIFRHHFATALIDNGISRATVSDLVGHDSPSSLDAYLSTDFPKLKQCAISIETFPVAKEVFANG